MKKISSKTKILCVLAALLLVCSFTFSTSLLAKSYVFKWTNIKQVEITAYRLNVRTGPSTSFTKIGTLSQGDIIDVLGSLGSWYVVHLDNDMVGVISSTYTRVYSYHNPPETEQPDSGDKDKYSGDITADEQKMINLINTERKNAGLTEYKVDMELMRVARIKAEDLSNNKYFSHDSPIYGSPFQMLKDFGISYSYAGENIAGNRTVEDAQNALMNSSGHKANILSSNYDTVGIGILDDSRYGKVFVQMFLKK